jgi:preprotein translocase subunit SecD
MKFGLLKNYKVLLLVVLVVLSIAAIGPNFNPRGVIVTAKDRNSTAPVNVNDVILSIDGEPATPELLEQPYSGLIQIVTGKKTEFFQANGTLGVSGKAVPGSNLRFGLDIEGGIRTVLTLEKSDNLTLDQTVSTLQTRINLYGLREANLRPAISDGQAFVEISIAGGTRDEITALLERQGKFETRVQLLPKIVDGAASLDFDKPYTIAVSNDSIAAEGKVVRLGETLTLGTVPLTFNGIIGSSLNLSALTFSGEEVVIVYADPQHAGIQPQPGGGYRWFFTVQLTQEAAQRFSYITKNLDRIFTPGAGESYLSSQIELYLDGELVDSLNIVSSLQGQVIQEPSVTGFGRTSQEAQLSQKRLQTILRSGSLPTKVEVVQMEVVSPRLGQAFLSNIVLTIVAALAAVSVIVSLRYRKLKLIAPIIVTSFSEVMIIFGASVAIGWTIDLASIAAIIAIIGTGIDAQIILIDQALRGDLAHQMSVSERIKRAFFVIVGSGGTVIAAMLPLMVLGLGFLRGFAITTMVGVLIGIFITRPAFGELVKKIVPQAEL